MKMFLGTGDVGSILNEWSLGFRELGVKAVTAVHSKNPFFPQNVYDIDLSGINKKLFKEDLPLGGYSSKQFVKKGVNLTSRFFQSLKFVSEFDVFLFVTPALSVFTPEWDFELIKRLNKQLIIVCVGSDIRHISGFVQEFPCDESLFDDRFKFDDISRPLTNLRRAEKYADIIYSVPDQSSMAIRNYNHFQIPLNLNNYSFKINDREIPVVVHAPSRRGIKGTEQILAAIERLKNEGINFEFRLLENVNNDLIRENLKDTDILVDQLVLHGPATLSFEAMCSGCAVAVKYLESSPACFRPPVLNINDLNIYERLKELLLNRELRKRLAIEGRKYVENNNHYTVVSRRIFDDLKNLEKQNLHYDYKPTFFKKKYHLPDNVN